jgi:hypothetical protein
MAVLWLGPSCGLVVGSGDRGHLALGRDPEVAARRAWRGLTKIAGSRVAFVPNATEGSCSGFAR